jgi:hypothetical protein
MRSAHKISALATNVWRSQEEKSVITAKVNVHDAVEEPPPSQSHQQSKITQREKPSPCYFTVEEDFDSHRSALFLMSSIACP